MIIAKLSAAATVLGVVLLQWGVRRNNRGLQWAALWLLVCVAVASLVLLPFGPMMWATVVVGILSAWPLWRWRDQAYLPDRAITFLSLAALIAAAMML